MDDKSDDNIAKNREFLKANFWGKLQETDQKRGKKVPKAQKSYPDDSQLIELVAPAEIDVGQQSLLSVMEKRRSRRSFVDRNFTLEELSFLTWAVQGLNSGRQYFRTVPSAGARHPF